METALVQDVTKQIFAPPELGCVLCLAGPPGGGSKIYDRSPYGHVGTIFGAVWRRLPSGLWCLSFDGNDDHVAVPDAPGLDITDQITIITWLNAPDPTQYYRGFVRKGALDQGYHFMFDGNTGKIGLWLELSVSGWVHAAVHSVALVANRWHFIAAVYNGKGGFAVVDYAVGGITPCSGLIQNTGGNALLMAESTPWAEHLLGKLALTRVFNRALSPLQLQNCRHREKHLFGVW